MDACWNKNVFTNFRRKRAEGTWLASLEREFSEEGGTVEKDILLIHANLSTGDFK